MRARRSRPPWPTACANPDRDSMTADFRSLFNNAARLKSQAGRIEAATRTLRDVLQTATAASPSLPAQLRAASPATLADSLRAQLPVGVAESMRAALAGLPGGKPGFG